MAKRTFVSSALPAPGLTPLVPKLVGQVFFRPWWDAVGVPAVTGLYFPLSRAWAAAVAADGDMGRFASALGIARAGPLLSRRASAVARLGKAYGVAEETWRQAMFATEPHGQTARAERTAITRRRDRAAFRFMGARQGFLPWLRSLPPVAWDVAGPAEVEARRGACLANHGGGAYAAPAFPEISVSAPLADGRRRQSWLRYPSPMLDDEAWAHVYEPADTSAQTTVIFLHGIAVEGEMWPEAGDPFARLLERNIRVIRPTGPWHGRRMIRGYYGGEPIIARGLEGMLGAFQAWLAEIAILVRWAREQGSTTVVLGGVSLGSLTAQLAATACRRWPEAMRPDVLFLVATTGSLIDVAFDGSLAKSLGIPSRLRQAGWTDDAIAPWLPLLEPRGPSAIPAERIVMVLGQADDLTPFPGGDALARRWEIPKENLFLRHQGHFSVVLGLLCDPKPIDRLLAIVEG